MSVPKNAPIPVEQLRWRCDPSQQGVAPADVPAVEGAVGQERARRALELGLGMKAPGYNVFITGLTGSGRMFTVERLLRGMRLRTAPKRERVFVQNFVDATRPQLLSVAPGVGVRLAKAMAEALDLAKREIPALFESETYVSEREAISKRLHAEERRLFAQIEQELAADGLVVVSEGDEPYELPDILPQVGAEAVTFEVLRGNDEARVAFEDLEAQRLVARGGSLPEEREERKKAIELRIDELEKRAEEYGERISELSKSGRRLAKEAAREIRELERRTVKRLLDDVHHDLERELEAPEVRSWLEAAFAHMLEHVEALFGSEADESSDPFADYRVNVVQEAGDSEDAPIVLERHPTFTNLFGTIEPERSAVGLLPGTFSGIRSGSLLRADGGYLILYAKDVLLEPGVWRNLVRTLRFGQLEIQAPESALALAPSALKPESIEVDVKVILIGDEGIYQLLEELEEEFSKVFKVKAEFDTSIDRNNEAVSMFAGVAHDIQKKESLLTISTDGMAALVEEAVRSAGRQNRISTRFGDIADILREADYWGRKNGTASIDAETVREAVWARRDRHLLLEEKIQDAITESLILIATEGERVGQINGLSYYELGEHAFGKPSRLTAVVSPGRQGVINIERESQLSGPRHDKGVLILSGLLRARYGQRRPLALTASIAFEQSYGGIDGDSASLAELLCILSAISELPIRQGFAVTGSVNQLGDVQAIGGVNEKIEGFHQLCKQRGFRTSQGCIIPKANELDLMLDHPVVEDAQAGRFVIFGVSTLDEAIALAFGRSAKDVDAKVSERLEQIGRASVAEVIRKIEKERPRREPVAPRRPTDPKPPTPGKR